MPPLCRRRPRAASAGTSTSTGPDFLSRGRRQHAPLMSIIDTVTILLLLIVAIRLILGGTFALAAQRITDILRKPRNGCPLCADGIPHDQL